MSNELVPFGMTQLRPKAIHPIAQKQLEQWSFYAKRWGLRAETRETEEGHKLGKGVLQLHLVCAGYAGNYDEPVPWGPCGTSVYTIHDGGNFSVFDTETINSLVVAHIRNVHRDIEETVYNGTAAD